MRKEPNDESKAYIHEVAPMRRKVENVEIHVLTGIRSVL